MLSLSGLAHDPEDGEMSPSQIQWFSDIDGLLGSGSALSIVTPYGSSTPLSSGVQVIELRATDTLGATATDSVTVTVSAAP
jgi:hypothetical protein